MTKMTKEQVLKVFAVSGALFLGTPKVFALPKSPNSQSLGQGSLQASASGASSCPSGTIAKKTNSAFQPYICVPKGKPLSSNTSTSKPLTIAQKAQALACVEKKTKGKRLSQKQQNAIIKACFTQAAKTSKGGAAGLNGAGAGATGYKKSNSSSAMPHLKKVNPIEQPVPGKNGTVLDSFPGPTVFQGTPDKNPPPNPNH